MAGKTPGRRPKLTRDVEGRLLKMIELGIPREVACNGVGIADRTLRIWEERARRGEAKFVEFADKMREAEAKAQSSILIQIRKAGSRDWKALAWFLERVYSERYGYKSQVKVSVEAELEKLLDVATDVLGAEAAAKLFSAIAGEALPKAAGESLATERTVN